MFWLGCVQYRTLFSISSMTIVSPYLTISLLAEVVLVAEVTSPHLACTTGPEDIKLFWRRMDEED